MCKITKKQRNDITLFGKTSSLFGADGKRKAWSEKEKHLEFTVDVFEVLFYLILYLSITQFDGLFCRTHNVDAMCR